MNVISFFFCPVFPYHVPRSYSRHLLFLCFHHPTLSFSPSPNHKFRLSFRPTLPSSRVSMNWTRGWLENCRVPRSRFILLITSTMQLMGFFVHSTFSVSIVTSFVYKHTPGQSRSLSMLFFSTPYTTLFLERNLTPTCRQLSRG